MTNYWLMKTEPATYSIDNLKQDGFSFWEGVRNFQARNFMCQMKEGDVALFYHSNATPPGIAGICRICREAVPDTTALDPKSKYYDKRAKPNKPIWFMVEVEFVEKFPHFVSLKELRENTSLKTLKVLQKGSRLSILPVDQSHFETIRKMGIPKD